MKLSKLILVSFFFTTSAFAGNVSIDEDCSLIQDLTKGLKGIAKTICAQVATNYKNGKASQGQVVDACTNVKEVVWDPTRNNSMRPANSGTHIDKKVNMASAFITGQRGSVAATQVCPGVFLTTAHGLLSRPDPRTHKPLFSLKELAIGVKHYPLSSKAGFMKVDSKHNIYSPRVNSNGAHLLNDADFGWKNDHTDFAFVKVNSPQRPHNFIPLLSSDSTELENAVNYDRKIDLFLYRPKSASKMVNGRPRFGTPSTNDRREQELYHNSIQKVHHKCNMRAGRARGGRGLYSVIDCPTEEGVSGSALISTIDRQPYHMGVVDRGGGRFENTRKATFESNYFLNTKAMCVYYEKACGKPCVELSKVLR